MALYQTQCLKNARPMQPALAVWASRWTSLGESKKLDYVTKAGNTWLVETVKAILRELGIEHAEHPDENVIVCCLHRGGFHRLLEIAVSERVWRENLQRAMVNAKATFRLRNKVTDGFRPSSRYGVQRYHQRDAGPSRGSFEFYCASG